MNIETKKTTKYKMRMQKMQYKAQDFTKFNMFNLVVSCVLLERERERERDVAAIPS
jgi:hypothetical protein